MARWGLRSKAILIAGALLGALVGLRVWMDAQNSAAELTRLDFSLAATQRASLIREALRAPAERLDTLSRFFENSDDVTPKDFVGFLHPWLQENEGLRFAIEGEGGGRNYGTIDSDLKQKVADLALRCDAGEQAAADIIGDVDRGEQRMLIVRPIVSRGKNHRYAVAVADIATRVKYALRTVDVGGLPTSVTHPGTDKTIVFFNDARAGGTSAAVIERDSPFIYVEAIEVAGIGLEIRVEASGEYLARRKNGYDILIVPAFALLFVLLAYAADALLRRGDRAERLSAQALRELETFFTLDIDLLCIADEKERLLRVNPAWERTLGFSKEELIGASLLDLMHPDDLKNAERGMAVRASEAKAIASYITRMRRKDGSWLRIEWKSAAVGSQSYSAARDVTEREAYEARLRTMLAEKETLLREVHHRVKNNMQIISSLLNLQSRDLSDPKITESMENAQGRIRTMAMVHDALYHSKDLSDIDFDSYAENLASACVHGLDRRDLLVKVKKNGLKLGLDLAIPCGLILNELATNSARYAFRESGQTTLTISLSEAEGRMALDIGDDGKGFDENFDLEADRGLGLMLVTSLAAQLGGRLERIEDGGAHFRITFKPAQLSSVSRPDDSLRL